MSLTKRIFFGAAASWFSRGVTILLGLVLMPVLFRTLPKEELGVWLLLGQSWATLGILDLGFGVTLTRRIAFAKGKSGSDPNVALNDATRSEIADLLTTGLRIYRVLAGVAFAVAFVSGFFYLRSLTLESVALPSVWTAWGIMCLSFAFTTWASPWTCLLQGVGYIGWDAILASFVSALTLIGQIVVALCGGGLVSLASVAVVGALLQRAAILGFARRNRPELFQLRGTWRGDTFREMLPLAVRAWLTAMGTILVQNTDSLFIASARGAENIPAFRAAFLLVLNLHMLAGVFASSSSVFISHLWQSGDLAEIHRIVTRNLRLGLGIVSCGGAVILGGGSALFDMWLGPGNYVGSAIIALFVATFILEQQTYILSTSCRATNDEAFAGCMFAGGLLKLVCALFGVKMFGLLGLAVATLMAQSITVHWFVVHRSLRRIGFGFTSFCIDIIAPCMVAFCVATAGCLSVVRLLSDSSDLVKVAATSAVGGFVLSLSCWFGVLEGGQRARLLESLGSVRLRQ